MYVFMQACIMCYVCMYVCMYVMDHMNRIRIKSARLFNQILEEVMKSEKVVRNCQKNFKQIEMVEPFHPVTYKTWKCCSGSSSDNNDNNDTNDDDDSGGRYEGR